MQSTVATVIALANPQLRERLTTALHAQGVAAQTPANLHDLTRILGTCSIGTEQRSCVLVLDEAFIYPHVYEECILIREACQVPLTVLLLVEPRTRTRWDWNGVDYVLRLPMSARDIASRVVGSLAAQK